MMEALHTETGFEGRATRDGISLSDLKSRRTPVEWFEGIAVTQELCRALLASAVGADGASFGAAEVVIDSAGSVRVGLHETDENESAVRQVGGLLQLMLAESPFPVPLRLVITQSTSTPPFYSSVADLSSALEYFERPDRLGLIRALYERAQKLPVLVDTAMESSQQSEQQKKKPALPKKKPAPKDKAQRRPLPKGLIFGAAAAVAVVAIGAGALSWSSGRSQPDAPVAAVENDGTTPPAAGRTASSSGSAITRAAVAPFRNASPKRAAAVTISPDHPGDPALDTAGELTPLDLTPVDAADDPAPVTFAAYDVVVGSEPASVPIYSASDRDVTPPLATYPRVPAPPAGVRAEGLSTLELLVNESGEVESVRLQGRPAHLGEALQATVNLSAAKTWRFAPAVKDGRPVKYRKLVQVRHTAS